MATKPTKPLRHRLTTLVAVAVFGAVTIVTSSSIWRETAQYRADEYAELRASANAYGAAIAQSVSYGARQDIQNALQPIADIPSVVYVAVEDHNGNLLAELGNQHALETIDSNNNYLLSLFKILASNSTTTSVPVMHGEEQIAILTLHAQAGELSGGLGLVIFDVLVAAIFAGGIGVLIAIKIQRTITNPLHKLADTMTKVRESGDFSLRAASTVNDETKELVDTFNELLDQLQDRDVRLQANQSELKKLVQKRALEVKQTKETAEAIDKAKSEFIATMSHEIRTPMNGVIGMANLLSNSRLPLRQKRYADIIAKSGQNLLAIINDILDFSKIEAGRLEVETIPLRPSEIVDDIVGLFWERAASKGLDLAAYLAPNVPERIMGDPVRIRQVVSNLVSNAIKFTETGHVAISVKYAVSKQGAAAIEFIVADTGVGIADEKLSTIFEAFSQADQTTTRHYGGTGLGLAICKRLVKAMRGTIGVSSASGKGSKFEFAIPTKAVEQPAPAPIFAEGKTAFVALHGAATPKLLVRFLKECGLAAKIVDPTEITAADLTGADIMFASPASFETAAKSLNSAPADWSVTRICVCEFGEASLDALFDARVAQDILAAPLARAEVMQMIERIRDNKLRGKSALSYSEGDVTPLVSFARQRVLAADDGAVNREVVKEALCHFNLDVTLVSNGEEALSAAENGEFDLILMDCSMPKMDGYEATRAIRVREQRQGRNPVPIVALSAHVTNDETAWRDAGMNGYLTKPFTLKALAAELSAHFGAGARGVARTAPMDELIEREEDASKHAPATEDQIFDVSVLEHLLDMQTGAENLALRALNLFRHHGREAMITLIESPKAGDQTVVEKAAHALKSMCLSVGAKKLAAVCNKIEDRASDGASPQELSSLIRSAGKYYRETDKELPAIIEQYSRSAA